MIVIGRKEFGINGFAIRLLALICMGLSGVGYIKGIGYDWLESFGWTSFAFYAFLLVEGVAYSSGKIRYIIRVLIFAAISEPLYDYLRFNSFVSWRYFSVMATILLSLILLCILSLIKKRFQNMVLDMICIAALGYGAYYVAERFNLFYGGIAIVVVLMFYVAREVTYTKITQFVVLIYICFYMTQEVLTHVTVGNLQYPVSPQLFCLIALPFIWLYDDNRGPNSIALQIVQYAFYPIVLGALIFLKYFSNF